MPTSPCPPPSLPQAPGVFLPLDPAALDFCRWRVWAAEVRDGHGPHATLPDSVKRQGGLLAKLLDLWQESRRRQGQASNLWDGLEGSIESLTGWLLLRGVQPPR